MDLKKYFVLCCFCALIWAPLSLSAPASKVADLPYEEGQVQLSVDPTVSGNCKPDNTKWIFLGLFCTVLLGFLILICCFCLVKFKMSRRQEEYKRINDACQAELEKMRGKEDFYQVLCRENVVLDPLTAHPRLEVSEDGKLVKDSGNVLNVPDSDGRFDSHMFVLGQEGFVNDKHYWEVDVDQKKNWDLGIASESIRRKGKIVLAPHNGYLVIGLSRKGYWARTDPWTPLKVSGTPTKIGIFLDMLNAKLSFYDVDRKSKLYTFTIPSLGTFYPFFSVGPVTEELDSCPLKILK